MTEVERVIQRDRLPSLDVWAVEPFFGGSHRAFLEGLSARSGHRMTHLTLPGRNWKWRMQGGALTLGGRARRLIERVPSHAGRVAKNTSCPDVLLASDMLDLPGFLAVAGPGMAEVPALVYFHENQLTYPLREGEERDLGYGMTNILSAVAADVALFNSDFHRREFLAAVEELWDRLPDEVPEWVPAAVSARSRVLPVGCDLAGLDREWERGKADAGAGRWGDPGRGPLIVWNQRWEYDKAPKELFCALAALKDEGIGFRVAVAGTGHGRESEDFLRAAERLRDRIVQWGRLPDRADYASLLWAADVVASTAIHEFFGIAVVEAVYCGCRPVLPWRLSYPEIVPVEAHADVLFREGGLTEALRRALAQPDAWSEDWQRTWVARYDWAVLAPRYDEEMRRCWAGAREVRKWNG